MMTKRVLIAVSAALALSVCGAEEAAKAGASDATAGASARQASTGDIYYMRSPDSPDRGKPMQARDLYYIYKEKAQGSLPDGGKSPIAVSGVVVYAGSDVYREPSVALSDKAGGKAFVLCVLSSFDELKGIETGKPLTVSGTFHIISSSDSIVLKQGRKLP